MWNKKDSNNDNQLWYEDHATGTIRSKLNDLCIDLEGDEDCSTTKLELLPNYLEWLK